MSKKSKKISSVAKRHPKLFITLVILLVIVIAALAIFWCVRPDIFHKYLGFGDHTFSEWVVETDADCGNDGLKNVNAPSVKI